MKNILFSTMIGALLLSISFSCKDSSETKVSITDSDDTYEFYAKFDKSKTRQIQDFINKKIAPSSLITDRDLDVTTTLDDKTQFEIKQSPGKVHIKLDKEDNTVASYIRIKKICNGIRGIISEKKS